MQTMTTPPVAVPVSAPAARPSRSAFSRYWSLDPNVTFLNHGSYGVCPIPVREAQDRYRALMEQEPVRWFMHHLERLLDISRRRLAEFVNCPPTDIGFLPNATVAISTILHSIDFKAGDEVLVNDHEYMSVINELRRMEGRRGIRVNYAQIPFPISSPKQAVDAILAKVTPRTRFAIISHITSPTALVAPVKEIVAALKARGIETLVDGAHAPGCIPVDIRGIGCTYYVATLHKWVNTPKGAGFMYAQADRQANLRPLALSSRGHQERGDRTLYLRDFDYLGTDDYSPVVCVPDALDFGASLLPGGWPELMQRNHDLAMRAREVICEVTGLPVAAPESMVPTMTTIPLPALPERLKNLPTIFGDPLQDRLVGEHRIQVPIWTNDITGMRAMRISCQVYNTIEEYRYLAQVLKAELEREQG